MRTPDYIRGFAAGVEALTAELLRLDSAIDFDIEDAALAVLADEAEAPAGPCRWRWTNEAGGKSRFIRGCDGGVTYRKHLRSGVNLPDVCHECDRPVSRTASSSGAPGVLSPGPRRRT